MNRRRIPLRPAEPDTDNPSPPGPKPLTRSNAISERLLWVQAVTGSMGSDLSLVDNPDSGYNLCLARQMTAATHHGV